MPVASPILIDGSWVPALAAPLHVEVRVLSTIK